MVKTIIEHPVLMCDPFKTPVGLAWRIMCNDTNRKFTLKTLPSVNFKSLQNMGLTNVVVSGASSDELGMNFDSIIHFQNLVKFPSFPAPDYEFPVSLDRVLDNSEI